MTSNRLTTSRRALYGTSLMAWLGVIRPLHKGEEFPLPLWQARNRQIPGVLVEVAMGVVVLVEVHQGGELPHLHSKGRRGAMMAIFSFRRSTRSSRPFSSGEMMTSGSASRPSSVFHASSSSIGSHSRPFVNTLSARAQLSSSGCSSRRRSRPLSTIPLCGRRWVT